MLRIGVFGACTLIAATFSVHAGTVGSDVDQRSPPGVLALIPNELLPDLDPAAMVIHDYGAMSLVRVGAGLSPGIGARAHLFPPADSVGFRGWSERLPLSGDLTGADGPVFILDLVGPLDETWRTAFEALGVEILAPADPHALVVMADRGILAGALQITTSEGFPVIRGVGPLPTEARVHRSLAPLLGGDMPTGEPGLLILGFGGRQLSSETKAVVGDGRMGEMTGRELEHLLRGHPEIGYAEPVFGVEPHNNLAPRPSLVAVEPVWDLGYNGSGVTVSHNDSGVDLTHPDLADAVTAVSGRMAYADTAHGTHTAGSIVGRGSFSAPFNTSGCGDHTQGLPTVRGMAWGAEIVTNNIFEGGYGTVAEMMAWGARNGAHLSSNSWGQVGLTGPVVGYTSGAVEADAAVRDADPDQTGPQPLASFFSAGNVGPEPGTVTSPATAKNVVTIGAVQNDRCGAWVPGHQLGPDPDSVLTTSGRGPTQGRLKPDLVAPGSDVLSVESGDTYGVQLWDEAWTGQNYAINTGTSQACAVAAGAGAVLHEALWRERGRRPSPALVKAALIAAADNEGGGPDYGRGWGRVDLAASVRGPEPGSVAFFDQDETSELSTGLSWSAPVVVRSSSTALKLALVWTDVPGEEDADHPLVNDLDLVLTAPDGTVYHGNVFAGAWSIPDPGTDRDADNNVEVIRIEVPGSGTWIADVVGVNVSVAPSGLAGQDFALAISGDAGPCAEAPLPPVEVEATRLGDNQIRVGWSAVSGATRYEISRSDDPGGHPYVPIATVAAGVGSFLDTAVSGGSEYHYVVRTYRSCWSEYSDEASATAEGACLLTPVFAGLASVDDPARSSCSLELSWAPADPACPGVVMYTVYRGDQPGFELSADNRLVDSTAGTYWRDRPLESGRDYYYLVRAWHHGQTDDDGNTVEIGGRPSGPDVVYLDEDVEGEIDGWIRELGSPSDTGTEPWGVTDDDAWAGESAFYVADEDRVKDQVLRTAEPIALPAGSEPILEFDHRFRLRNARDGGRLEYSTDGGSDWHDILEGDGQTVPDDPQRWRTGGYTDTIGAPTNPLFRAEGWTGDSRGWVHSRVDLSDFAGRRLLLRWRMGCDETPGEGWGWWLDEIRLVVEHDCLPCLGGDPPADPAARATDDGVVIEWDDFVGATAYRVSRSMKVGGPFETLAVIAAPETSYHDTAASGGSDYTYVYSVGYGECWSDNSPGVTVTAGGPCRRAPLFWGLDEVVDRREAGCALDLEWRAAEPGCAGAGVEYLVYRSIVPSFEPDPESLIAGGVKGTRFRDTTVVDGELYHYRVRAADELSLAEDDNPVVQSGWTTGPEDVHFSDSVEGSLDGWSTGVGSSQDSGTDPWGVVDDVAHSGERSWFCRNEPRVKDQVVALVDGFEILDDSTVFSFYHLYDLEPFWDGGRLEYSTDGGSSWHDILHGNGATVGDNPGRFLRGGYSGFVSVGTGHPFGGERAWTGFDDGWTDTVVDLTDFVGLTVRFRWRLGCDRADARAGWWVDDVELRTTTRCETVALPQPRRGQGRRP